MSKVKERPLLYSGPMVRASLEGCKTQTRRTRGLEIINAEPDAWQLSHSGILGETYLQSFYRQAPDTTITIACPYGKPGDRLYVRETWGVSDYNIETCLYSAGIFYAADGPDGWTSYVDIPFDYPYERMLKLKTSDKHRPSIHMPRWASRILLEIVAIRAERLQDISEADIIAEGCPPEYLLGSNWYRPLWDSLNAERGYGWNANPYVWVVEFRVIKPEAK